MGGGDLHFNDTLVGFQGGYGEAIPTKSETAEKGLPRMASSAERIGTSAASSCKVRELGVSGNPRVLRRMRSRKS
jgi:hypothetical protein